MPPERLTGEGAHDEVLSPRGEEPERLYVLEN
jgi:hypothetical protein